ncbi:hypothetical protein MFRU_007g03430 [Monilinia fructicola]|nr:hypothetical protein MFRU_007g03430 [Monilinia fructicola]
MALRSLRDEKASNFSGVILFKAALTFRYDFSTLAESSSEQTQKANWLIVFSTYLDRYQEKFLRT